MNKEKGKNTICYYHDDADGWASAAIVRKVYPKCRLMKVNHGDFIDANDYLNKNLIIVDFSFPRDLMDGIKVGIECGLLKSFCWIDHHKTAMETNTELWNSKKVTGLRSIEKSACELTWKWFFPNNETPLPIQYIGDYDMWKFKHKETKSFCEYLNMIVNDAESSEWKFLLSGDYDIEKNYVSAWCKHGNILLLSQINRVEKNIKEGIQRTFLRHNTIVINTNHDISMTGSYANKHGYYIAILWCECNGKIIVNMRSKIVDVGTIAKSFGGGGHKEAAGFTVSNFGKLQELFMI